MAVAENAGARIGSSSQSLDNSTVTTNSTTLLANQKSRDDPGVLSLESDFHHSSGDQSHLQQIGITNTGSVGPNNFKVQMGQMQNGYEANGIKNSQQTGARPNGIMNEVDGENSFKRGMSDLEELLSKLNPMAEEFVPPSLAKNQLGYLSSAGFGFSNNFLLQTNSGNVNGNTNRRKKNGFSQGRRRMNYKMTAAQRDEMTRRTVYVSDIDQQVTEEQLAALFLNCGQVVDCRICGDPNSILHFAFIEFTDDESARAALTLSGTMLGYYPVRVLPSKTAIAPVNPEFLPRSADEREMCSRTIYCTNIDKKVSQAEVKLFFETLCGEVQRLRLLGDYHHSTRIAFVEFTMAESAITALNCSGEVLGSLPIRVSPSKTPVRPRSPRLQML